MHETSTTKNPSVLASLRSLTPEHEIGFQHALRVVERQAEELLRHHGTAHGATPDDIVMSFPRVKVVRVEPHRLEASGASYWNGSQWVIFLRRTDCHVRQRFTMCHELAHIIHHKSLEQHFTGKRFIGDAAGAPNAKKQRERAADHFAGCLLMPKAAMLRQWAGGLRQPQDFANYFDVSTAAATIRMEQLGLLRPRWMCTRGLTTAVTPPEHAFSAKTENVLDRMRLLGLKRGQPTMRFSRQRRTLHLHHVTGGRP